MQTIIVRTGKSLPHLRCGPLPFTRSRAATPSGLITVCSRLGVYNADKAL